MIRIVFIFYFLISSAYADNREKIIERLKNTSSINFKFDIFSNLLIIWSLLFAYTWLDK